MLANPIVEIGFTTGAPVAANDLSWDDALRDAWDSNNWASDQLWTDVTDYLMAFSVKRGANRVEGPVIRYDAGTASVTLLNDDRRFDPLNLAGPYVTAGETEVRPNVQLRVKTEFNGTVYPLFSGYVDSVELTYPGPTHSQATFSATDGIKLLTSYVRIPVGVAQGAGELSGARVSRILDSVGWSPIDRQIETGSALLQGTVLDGDPWTELVLVQDTEIGEVFIDRSGRFVFRGRTASYTRPASVTSQGIFGSDIAGGELPYVSLQTEYDDATIRNLIRITRVGGIMQTAEDAASETKYLVHTFDRTDLIMTQDTDAANYAQFLLSQAKDPQLRFTQLVIDPRAYEAALFPQVLARAMGDRVTVRARPPGGGLVERDVFIRGIDYDYTAPYSWHTAWTLQDSTTWAFAVWDQTEWDNGDRWVF